MSEKKPSKWCLSNCILLGTVIGVWMLVFINFFHLLIFMAVR